jgi:hypothetical protein
VTWFEIAMYYYSFEGKLLTSSQVSNRVYSAHCLLYTTVNAQSSGRLCFFLISVLLFVLFLLSLLGLLAMIFPCVLSALAVLSDETDILTLDLPLFFHVEYFSVHHAVQVTRSGEMIMTWCSGFSGRKGRMHAPWYEY